MTITKPGPIGGRRVARPAQVRGCTGCGAPLGAGYAACPECRAAIEGIWLADWHALLDEEHIGASSPEEKALAELVLLEFGLHPWTVMDIAMSLLSCKQCGGELGENYATCFECGTAFGASVQSEFGATPNEHALHIGRWVLRYPHRHPANAVAGWKLTLPRILTGWLPTTAEAQHGMALIKAGRIQEAEQAMREVDRIINGESEQIAP